MKTPPDTSRVGIWQAFARVPYDSTPRIVEALVGVRAGWYAPRADILARFPDLVQRCHDAGIGVYPWLYITPSTAVNGDVARFVGLMQRGCDGAIIDAEVEWDKDPNARQHAADFGVELRRALPDAWIADAPWPWIGWHPTYPTAEFAAFVDARLVQAYANEIGVDVAKCMARTRADWNAWDAAHPTLARPVLPIGDTYNAVSKVSTADLLAFIDGEFGASLYSLEACDVSVLEMLRERAAKPQLPPTPAKYAGPAHPLGDADRAEQADTDPAPPATDGSSTA